MVCNNCLCHLEVCQAECCKEFKITLLQMQRLFKGYELSWLVQDEDMKNYYKLHGLIVRRNVVTIKLNNYKQEGRIITIFAKCQALTDNNLCSLHNTPQQPKLCNYPNNTGTGGKVYLTHNCVYKKVEK